RIVGVLAERVLGGEVVGIVGRQQLEGRQLAVAREEALRERLPIDGAIERRAHREIERGRLELHRGAPLWREEPKSRGTDVDAAASHRLPPVLELKAQLTRQHVLREQIDGAGEEVRKERLLV